MLKTLQILGIKSSDASEKPIEEAMSIKSAPKLSSKAPSEASEISKAPSAVNSKGT